MNLTRRQWMLGAASAGASLLPIGCTGRRQSESPAGGGDTLARFPGKAAMRVINDRPPCLETPWRYFRHDLTPNEAFYVRWHLQTIPTAIDLKTWRLRIDGAVDRPLELSMDDLRRLGDDEVVAVNQCSGNSRSLFNPRVPGAQWRNGAMSNARWAGVGLAKVLRAAGVRRDAVQVTFDGMDEGPLASVPDFVKALDIDHALQHAVTVAYSMNGEPLPVLNGFPARLVVPGWYATYWVKALHRITILPHAFDGYWMTKAYKIPTNPNGVEDPHAKLSDHLIPINRMNVRSFVTAPSRARPCRRDGPSRSRGSPSTAAAASGASRSRSTEDRPGPVPCWATTWADIPSADGVTAGPRFHGASIDSWSGPRAVTGRSSPTRKAGTGADSCATSSRR